MARARRSAERWRQLDAQRGPPPTVARATSRACARRVAALTATMALLLGRTPDQRVVDRQEHLGGLARRTDCERPNHRRDAEAVAPSPPELPGEPARNPI